MPEPVTAAVGTITLAGLLTDLAVNVVGGEGHRKYRDLVRTLGRRVAEGGLPANAHLEAAVRRSLAGAALVVAYTLHDPERRLLREIIGSGLSWRNFKDFSHQVAELIGRTVIRDTASDSWLAVLIDLAERPESFANFNQTIVLSAGGPPRVVRPDIDLEIRDGLHAEFIRWADHWISESHLAGEHKPADFDEAVRNGLVVAGRRLTFYDVFRLFFREELKDDGPVHKAYVIDVLADLRANIDSLTASLPSDADRRELHTAVEKLGHLDTLARDFERQNREQLLEISGHFLALERKLDYLIGGLPLIKFRPEPPERELEILQARHCAIELVGRDDDLAALWSWLLSDRPVSTRLLIGGAGTGKTRLALELIRKVNERLPHWQAGVLGGSDLRRFEASKDPRNIRWAAPTLVVVDYAQTVGRPLRELLRPLVPRRRDTDAPPLRVLLLERQAGDWFDGLLSEQDVGGVVDKLFDPPAPVHLATLPSRALRRDVLSGTLREIARLRKTAPLKLPDTGESEEFESSLARPIFDQPLNLMLAGLVAADAPLLTALRRERSDLAFEVADKELRRIRQFARTPGDDGQERALMHLAACATIEQGFTDSELDRAVREELEALGLDWPGGPGDLATRLREMLPSDRLAVAPVQPDFVGEALILQTLVSHGRREQFWTETVERCCRRDPRFSPATLLHAFQNFGNHEKWARSLLAATDAIVRSFANEDTADLLSGIEAALPVQSLLLRARAADVTVTLHRRLKSALANGRKELRPEVARIANNLANRLSDVGRRAEALSAANEAVELRRELAAQNRDAFLPDLAMSISNLAGRLSDVGRWGEALSAGEEAVKLYRELVARNREAFLPSLAMSVNNLANRLSDVGKRAEALAASEVAVSLYRELVALNRDGFLPALATSLNNLASLLNKVGRRGEALTAGEESVTLRRELAALNRDAFLPALAMSMNNLSGLLGDVGRLAEALEAVEEAVALRRELVTLNRDAFLPNLATAVNNLANRLSDVGRRAEALAAGEEAVALGRELVALNRDAFLSDLAMSINNLANRLIDEGRPAEALAAGEEAVELRRELVSLNAEAFLPDLAMSLGATSYVLVELERPADACLLLVEAISSLRSAFEALPAAHAGLMTNLLQDYRRAAKTAGVTLDQELIAPILATFEALRALDSQG